MPTEPERFRNLIRHNLSRFEAELTTNKLTTIQKKPTQAIRVLQRAVAIDELWSPAQNLIADLAPLMERWGQWEGWQQLLSQSLHHAQNGSGSGQIVTLHVLSARLAQRQHHLAEVINHYRQAIRLGKRLHKPIVVATACTNLGYLYTELGQWWRAEILCCHALAIFEQHHHQHGLAHTHNHLGVLYMWLRQWEAAQQHLDQACTIWQANKDAHGLMRGQLNLGLLHNENGQPQIARCHLELALQQAQQIGEQSEQAKIYNNIGISYRLEQQFSQAEACYWQAATIFQERFNLLGLAQITNNLGIIYTIQQKWDEAKQYLEQSLDYYALLQNSYQIIQVRLDRIALALAQQQRVEVITALNEVIQRLEPYQANSTYQHLHQRVKLYQTQLARL